MRFIKKLLGILPLSYANTHCNVPCDIYEPHTTQTAALTVQTIVKKIKELEHPEKTDHEKHDDYINNLTRMIWTKEEHARKCKEEILILWTDYFKPEHLEKWPDLHDIFWKTAKLCSQNKQHVDEKLAQELVDSVNHIADIFKESKASS
jgi:nickel superoxide dismutase